MFRTLKRAASVATLATIATLVLVACAAAQLGPGGASGTRCVASTTEGRSSLGTVGLLSRQFALPWQGAFGSFVAAQITRTSSVPVVVRRSAAKR
jgi:hypothetical protein